MTGKLLTWKIRGEDKNANTSLERSINGKDFHCLYSPGNNETIGNYLDPHKASAFYRLKMVNAGTINYSEVVFVSAKTPKTASVYPTIIQPGQRSNFTGVKDGKYKVICTAINGEHQLSEIRVFNKMAIADAHFTMRGWVFVQLMDASRNDYHFGRVVTQ